jgi:hypothetical protein
MKSGFLFSVAFIFFFFLKRNVKICASNGERNLKLYSSLLDRGRHIEIA